MDVLEGIVQSFSPEEKQEAKDLEYRIEQITRVIISEKQSLDSNFVRLSQLIDQVRRKKYWLLGSYKNFGDYLDDCEKKFNVGHSQLYVGMKITRNLLPAILEEDLVSMGITKAGVLSKYIEQSGQSHIPEDLLNMAKDPTKKTDELNAEVNSRLHNVPQDKGEWFSLGGFFVDPDEKKEIQDALQLAKGLDPLVPNNIPQWQQLKECYLRLAREFLGTYS